MVNVIKADLDDILFEPREKKYGAYFIRKRNHHYLVAAFLVVSVFFATATIGPFLWEKLTENLIDNAETHIVMDMSTALPPPPEKKELPPPPPPPEEDMPPPPEKVIGCKFPEPKELPEEKEDAPPPPIDSSRNNKLGKENIQGEQKMTNETSPSGTGEPKPTEVAKDTDNDGIFDDEDDCPLEKGERKYKGCPPPPPPPPKKIEEPDYHAFVIVQEQPRPINMDEIRKKIGYPIVLRDGIEGVVMFRILVDENGNYVRHIVSKSAHPLLQAEVEKYVKELHFTPAIQAGKPIKFWVNIPFTFKLM